MKTLAGNKRAHFDYFLTEKTEAGLSLQGWEVKSARAGNVNLGDSFIFFEQSQTPTGRTTTRCFLKNAHFSPYEYGEVKNQDVRRNRQLLLNAPQIRKLYEAVRQKGFTCIATKLYLNKAGLLKLEIALAKGKQNYDKRQTLKERDLNREAERALRSKE